MTRLLSSAFAALFLFLCLPSLALAQSSGLKFKGFEEALELAAKEDKMVMVYFWADWCGFCRKIESEVFANEDVQKAFDQSFLAVSVNVQDDPGDLKGKYRASALPTLTFLNSKGEKVVYWEGFTEAETFLKILEYINSEKKS